MTTRCIDEKHTYRDGAVFGDDEKGTGGWVGHADGAEVRDGKRNVDKVQRPNTKKFIDDSQK